MVATLPRIKRWAPRDDLERVPRRADPAAPQNPTTPEPRTASRSRRTRGVEIPLGSLTQPEHRHGHICRTCGSDRVTRLAMELTDGTPVDFLSCHVCESRVWERNGTVLDIDTVLDHARRTA